MHFDGKKMREVSTSGMRAGIKDTLASLESEPQEPILIRTYHARAGVLISFELFEQLAGKRFNFHAPALHPTQPERGF